MLTKAQRQRWANDREFSLDQFPDPSSTADLLWIELSLHSDNDGGPSNYVLEAWWGVGEQTSSGSPSIRKQLGESRKFRCSVSE